MKTTRSVSEIAYAKINLALHVRNKQADGYHELDTLFAFANDGDRLSIVDAPELSLVISGPFGENLSSVSDNLVMRTALLMRARFGVAAGAAIRLEKNLPIASGIGGGSADAAATARALNILWDLKLSKTELCDLLAPLGADIPACVASELVRGLGTGTTLTPLSPAGLSGRPILLVNPIEPVPTAAVFANWDGTDRGPLRGAGAYAMMRDGCNDLQPAAEALCPAITTILAALNAQSPEIVRMSGSGATCFAIFASEEHCQTAQLSINAQYPDFWQMTATMR
jgi:4-diphosphocytidyl-2-C-methyl-D-erythritol kinase